MNRIPKPLLLVVSVAVGLITAGFIYRLLPRSHLRKPAPPAYYAVLAATTLPPGTTLAAQDLQIEETSSKATPGLVSNPQLFEGRIVRRQIARGSPITEKNLRPIGSPTSPIPPGYRAIDVWIEAQGGAYKFLSEGDGVDVVLTLGFDSQRHLEMPPASQLLLQNVLVLSTPSPAAEGGKKAEKVPITLAVLPLDAERLSLAMQVGTIRLLPRNPMDEEIIQTTGIQPRKLFSKEGKPTQLVEKAPVPAGHRAFEVWIEARGSAHQFLSAGDRADVLTTLSSDSKNQKGSPTSWLLLQNILVLSVAPPSPGEDRTPAHERIPVTLAVTPLDAEKLSLAMQVGTIKLLPRHPLDQEIVPTSGIQPERLLPTEEKLTHPVEVIRGGERSLSEFDGVAEPAKIEPEEMPILAPTTILPAPPILPPNPLPPHTIRTSLDSSSVTDLLLEETAEEIPEQPTLPVHEAGKPNMRFWQYRSSFKPGPVVSQVTLDSELQKMYERVK